MHLLRFSLAYVSFKARKAVAADRKAIYHAVTGAEAEQQLAACAEKWDARYPSLSQSWRSNWARVSPLFGFPDDIRRAGYTTNAIESLNMSLRKVIKTRASFPNDENACRARRRFCSPPPPDFFVLFNDQRDSSLTVNPRELRVKLAAPLLEELQVFVLSGPTAARPAKHSDGLIKLVAAASKQV